MTIKVLRDKKAALLKEANTLASKEADGSISTEEASRYAAMLADGGEISIVNGQIARAERLMDEQRTSGVVVEDGNVAQDDANRDKKAGQFASLGDQMLAIARAAGPSKQTDKRLQWFAGPSGASEGVGSDGGFLVQNDFANELLQNTYTAGEIASRIRRIPVGASANGLVMNGVDETSRVNGSRWGGIQSFWTGEAQLITASQPKFRKIKLELDKLTGLCYATDELLADATALEAWLYQAFSDEFLFKIEDAVVNGSGAGMPLGFLNSGAVITITKEVSQPNTTIVAENVLKMWARMPARSRKNAVWLVNQDAEPQFYQFVIKVKNVAGSENVGGIAAPQVVYVPPGTNGNEYGLLMGRPVIPVEYAATLGTPGDIMLVDLSQYLAIDKGATQASSSIHVRFIYDETTFRFVYRFNGQPIWATAMTPYKGTNTQSPFIVLQQR